MEPDILLRWRNNLSEIEIVYSSIIKRNMTIEELSDKELTLVSSLVKQNKNKLEEIIRGAKKVNDVRTKRLIEIVEMVIDIKG